MEHSGLIIRKQKDGNRRSLYVSLTDKGIEAAENMQVIFKNTEDIATVGLSDEEQEELKRLLTNICDSLKKFKKGIEYEQRNFQISFY